MELSYLFLLPIGLVVGVFSAAFGIGGGILMAPVLVLLYGFDQHAAQGTSLAVIVPTAIAGAIAHHRRGFVDGRLALLMAAGGVPGVLVAARVALAIHEDALRTLFGVVVILSGVRLIVQGRSGLRRGAGETREGSDG